MRACMRGFTGVSIDLKFCMSVHGFSTPLLHFLLLSNMEQQKCGLLPLQSCHDSLGKAHGSATASLSEHHSEGGQQACVIVPAQQRKLTVGLVVEHHLEHCPSYFHSYSFEVIGPSPGVANQPISGPRPPFHFSHSHLVVKCVAVPTAPNNNVDSHLQCRQGTLSHAPLDLVSGLVLCRVLVWGQERRLVTSECGVTFSFFFLCVFVVCVDLTFCVCFPFLIC